MASERMSYDDLPEDDAVKRLREGKQNIEQRSRQIRERVQELSNVKPTQMGLTDPSQPLTHFCSQCGASESEPFGSPGAASTLRNHGVNVEVYPNGGIIIYTEHDVSVAIKKSSGLGTSGQLGFTKVVVTPEKGA